MLRDGPSLRGQELLDAVTQTVQSAHHGFFLSGAAAKMADSTLVIGLG